MYEVELGDPYVGEGTPTRISRRFIHPKGFGTVTKLASADVVCSHEVMIHSTSHAELHTIEPSSLTPNLRGDATSRDIASLAIDIAAGRLHK